LQFDFGFDVLVEVLAGFGELVVLVVDGCVCAVVAGGVVVTSAVVAGPTWSGSELALAVAWGDVASASVEPEPDGLSPNAPTAPAMPQHPSVASEATSAITTLGLCKRARIRSTFIRSLPYLSTSRGLDKPGPTVFYTLGRAIPKQRPRRHNAEWSRHWPG
jgi:hypothetical protein